MQHTTFETISLCVCAFLSFFPLFVFGVGYSGSIYNLKTNLKCLRIVYSALFWFECGRKRLISTATWSPYIQIHHNLWLVLLLSH